MQCLFKYVKPLNKGFNYKIQLNSTSNSWEIVASGHNGGADTLQC